jgi:transposase
MPPSYVKPYVRRGKTDQADAAAICEAVTRPSMRFVAVKSEESLALLMTHHKAREFLVRQLTQITNAIRALLAEFGIVAPKGVHNVGRLLEAGERADLPAAAWVPLRLLAEQFFETRDRIDALTKDIRREAENGDAAKRLQTIPGIGPITATALAATLPDTTGFRTSRDLSAWLTPKPHSSGGKEKLGRISKMGNRSLRRRLYLGAMGVITARRRGQPGGDWLWRLLQRKTVKQAGLPWRTAWRGSFGPCRETGPVTKRRMPHETRGADRFCTRW